MRGYFMATLQEIQRCELDILDNVNTVCKNNNINCYLAYGSLLGAVRHKGFIPWDDDVDVYMLYDDVEKFKRCCKKELPEKFIVQDFDNEPGSGKIFIKVRNKNTLMSETEGRKNTYNEGIWLDIFPLLKTGKNDKVIKKQIESLFKLQLLVLERIDIKKTEYSSMKSKMIRIFRELFYYRPMSKHYYKKVGRMSDKNAKSYIVMSVSFYDGYSEEKYKKLLKTHIISDDFLKKVKQYDFEDKKFLGFAEYDKYLKKYYGENYMTPVKYKQHVPDYSKVKVEEI